MSRVVLGSKLRDEVVPQPPRGWRSKINAIEREDRIAVAWATVRPPDVHPVCRDCRKPMRRCASKLAHPFWGCINFPECRYTLPPSGSKPNPSLGRKAHRRVKFRS